MTDTRTHLLTDAFRALSARLGSDPLQVQGAGGNTSVKDDVVMWIKASGTELANAQSRDIFVAVDRAGARAEAFGAGDGTCKATVLDPAIQLRPSIETTFHAVLDHAVVCHTHSVATLCHAISPRGGRDLDQKLAGLPFVRVPYAKPGLPLTAQIMDRIKPDTRVIVLQNHGLICCGGSVEEVSDLIADVEARLALPARATDHDPPDQDPPEGFEWARESWIAQDPVACGIAAAGSYYPDHVVFLGPALPAGDHDGMPPAILLPDRGIGVRQGATPAQRAMLRCLSDILARLPQEWQAQPIGPDAEADLLNWDAEKYRQALAAK